MIKQSRPDLDSKTHNDAADKNMAEKIDVEKSEKPGTKTKKSKAVGGESGESITEADTIKADIG